MYYLTQAKEEGQSRVTCECRLFVKISCRGLIRGDQAWFSSLLARLQRRPRAADGWEAVATEGEETVEIHQIQR